MRYYYLLIDDYTDNWFITTIDKVGKKNGRNPNQRFVIGNYETVFNSDDSFFTPEKIRAVAKINGMAANRVFDSQDEKDRRLLIKAILKKDDGVK